MTNGGSAQAARAAEDIKADFKRAMEKSFVREYNGLNYK
jgi:hypothetical protein